MTIRIPRDQGRWLAAQTPRLRRLVKEQAQVEAASKISKSLDVLLSAVAFVTGVTVAAWINGDWEITVAQMWTAVAILAVIVAVRVAWVRYRFRRIVRRARRLQRFCTDCGATEDLTVDHSEEAWRRRARGLSIRLCDVQILCRSCNSRKGAAR